MITLGPARLLRFRQRRLAQPPGAASRKNETSIISLSLAHIADDIGWRTYHRARNAEPNGHWQVAHPLRVACGTERTVLRDSRSRRGRQDLRIRGSYSPQFFLTRPILERGSQAGQSREIIEHAVTPLPPRRDCARLAPSIYCAARAMNHKLALRGDLQAAEDFRSRWRVQKPEQCALRRSKLLTPPYS
jgi:hypothetical protein